MIATEARQARCIIRGAPAIVTFYPDSHIVRISAEGGRCFEEMRWLFGWQALLDTLEHVEENTATAHEEWARPEIVSHAIPLPGAAG